MTDETTENDDDAPDGRHVEQALDQARRPNFRDSTSDDEWNRPSYAACVAAAYQEMGRSEPDDGYPQQVSNTPQDVVRHIAQWTLLGDPQASTAADLLTLPVCYPNEGGTLSEQGCLAARQTARQVGGISESTATSAFNMATRLLEEEFGHDFDDGGTTEDAVDDVDDNSDDTDESDDTDNSDDEEDGADERALQYREKSTQFRAADRERQVVYGAVLLSNELDHHGDFFRPPRVESLADEFMAAVADPDAEPAGAVDYPNQAGVGGVMHAVFPTQHLSLAENTILDEEQEVGTGPSARTFPADTWIQGWKIHDEQLWRLIDQGILSGYSIGMWLESWEEYAPGELPNDVRVPDAVAEDLAANDLTIDDVHTGEVTAGTVHEVSVVDMPAVPRAVHVAHKSADNHQWQTSPDSSTWSETREAEASHALAKAADALTESHASCVDYLVEQRGHSQADAEALASYLQRVVNGDGQNAGSPEKSASGGLFGRAKALIGIGSEESDDDSGAARVAATSDEDSHDNSDDTPEGTNLGGVTIEPASGDEEKSSIGATAFQGPFTETAVDDDADDPEAVWTAFLDALVDAGGQPFTIGREGLSVHPDDEIDPYDVHLYVAGLSPTEASGIVADHPEVDLDLVMHRTAGSTDASGVDSRAGPAAKAGRTLSERNRRRMMVVHDLTLSVLSDAGVAGERMPFVDDPSSELDTDVEAFIDGSADDRAHGSGAHSAEPTGAAAHADTPRSSPHADADVDIHMDEEELNEKFDSIDDSIDGLNETMEDLADHLESSEAEEEGSEETAESENEDELSDEEKVDQMVERLEERLDLSETAEDEDGVDIESALDQIADNQKALANRLGTVEEVTAAIAEADGVSQQSDRSLVPDEEPDDGGETDAKTSFLVGGSD